MRIRMTATNRALVLLLPALLWGANCHGQETWGEEDPGPPTVERQKESAGKAPDGSGQPQKNDGEKVERSAGEAQRAVKSLPPAQRPEPTPGTVNQPSRFNSLAAFVRRNALTLVGVLTLTNLGLLVLVVYQWRRNRRRPGAAALLQEPGAAQPAGLFGSPAADGRSVAAYSGATPTEAARDSSAAHAEEIPAQAVSGNGWRKNGWLVVGASVPGKTHVASKPPIPCQDSNAYRPLGGGWGIAVVCDGAGSKEYSHYGASFVAERAAAYFEKIVRQNGWQESNSLPTEEQWQELSKRAFARIRKELEEYAREKHEVDSALLSCTVIVVVHSPVGILASHIGDGRAAFCNADNEWKAMIRPYKGEEANQTVFITSVEWDQPDKYIESTVFRERPLAFALMSDGCESHSFEVNVFDEQERKFKDLNRPYPKFFQPLVATLKNLYQNQVAPEEINAKWQAFIEGGSEKLKNEPDDKTMILGVVVN